MSIDYPLPKFHFKVDWGGAKMSFQEVTGLLDNVETPIIRIGDSKDFNKIKMPGIRKFTNITMKRGKFEKDFNYDEWLKEISNQNKRSKLKLRVFNDNNEMVAAVNIKRAFPVKITAPDLKAKANDVGIESIEISHEGLRKKRKSKKDPD